MRWKPPRTNAKRHHLVPEWYIRRFAFDGKRVYVFDRAARKVRADVPHNIAVQTEFNSITMRGGEKDRAVEGRLAELDDAAAKCLPKLEAGEALEKEECWYVSFFVGYADARSRGFRHAVLESMPTSIDYSDPGRGFVDPQFLNAFCAVSGVALDSWTLERMISESVKDATAGPFEIGSMVHHGFELARHIYHSQWSITEAEGGAQFLASDRPLGILTSDGGFGDDPFEPSSIRIFPMSPRQALLIRGRRNEEAPEYDSISERIVRTVDGTIAGRRGIC